MPKLLINNMNPLQAIEVIQSLLSIYVIKVFTHV